MRRKSGARLVAITGSAGKTTTKEVAAAFLALRHRTFRNRGNLNNHIGLPLSLLELGRDGETPGMAVVELGMSAPGEIRTLLGIAEPDVRVWTNVAEAHLEHFPSVEAIADAKAEILEGAGADDVLVANAGDARVMARASRFAGRTRDVRSRSARRRVGDEHRIARHPRHGRRRRHGGRHRPPRDAARRPRQSRQRPRRPGRRPRRRRPARRDGGARARR